MDRGNVPGSSDSVPGREGRQGRDGGRKRGSRPGTEAREAYGEDRKTREASKSLQGALRVSGTLEANREKDG